MNNLFGISFSESALHIAQSQNGTIESVKSVPYVFPFGYDTLFSEKNVIHLADMVARRKKAGGLDELGLSVSLPLNFAHIKKVALPLQAGPEVTQAQVEWELNNHLSDDLSEYKIINTHTEFEFQSYREVIFIAIKKEILKAISKIAELTESQLKQIVPANFVVEKLLLKNKVTTNSLVIKLEKTVIHSQLFVDNKYYFSYMDSTKTQSPNEDEDETQRLFEISKERITHAEKILKQLPFGEQKKLDCFVYGDILTPELEKLFANHFNNPVKKLLSDYQGISNSGLEAVEVLSD